MKKQYGTCKFGTWASIIVLLALLIAPAQSQSVRANLDETFAVSSMTPGLFFGAQAVVRLEEKRFEVESPKRAKETVHRAVTVLEAGGRSEGELVVWYDKLHRLEKLEGRIRDAMGKVIRKLEDDDLEDVSAISDYSLYDDSRIRVARLYHDTYPYTVEYEYERAYHGLISWPIWTPQEEALPVEVALFKVVVPDEVEFRYVADDDALTPQITRQGKQITYQWAATKVPAFVPEPWGPAWEEQVSAVYTAPTAFEIEGAKGGMDSWASFGQWYHRLSKGRDQLSQAQQNELQQRVADAPDDREKARRIYHHLQETTRYVSIQLGLGGWQPYDALYVNERGYGDCKALTNYMLAMLQAVGVKAYPALIRNGLSKRDVRPDFVCNQFNHVVLYVPLETEPLWLECTSQTIPFGHLGASNQDRYALVVRPDSSLLVRTPTSTAQHNRKDRIAHIEVLPDGAAKAQVETHYTGNQEDHIRGALAQRTMRDREVWLQETLAIPSFELQQADFSSMERRESTTTIDATLALPHYATVSGQRLFLPVNLLERSTSVPPAMDERTQPVAYGFAFVNTDTLHYRLPEGYTVENMNPTLILDEPFGQYRSEIIWHDDGRLSYHRSLEITARQIPAAQYEAFRTFMQQVARSDRAQVVLVRKK